MALVWSRTVFLLLVVWSVEELGKCGWISKSSKTYGTSSSKMELIVFLSLLSHLSPYDGMSMWLLPLQASWSCGCCCHLSFASWSPLSLNRKSTSWNHDLMLCEYFVIFLMLILNLSHGPWTKRGKFEHLIDVRKTHSVSGMSRPAHLFTSWQPRLNFYSSK